MSTASERGRSNRNRGAVAERQLVGWLRDNGFPGAERAVRTAYRTAGRALADPGDVTGTPGLVWQVKYTLDFEEPAVLVRNLAETEQQRATVDADFGILVQRRVGAKDPGRWWVWLKIADLYRIIRRAPKGELKEPGAFLGEPPVRMELAALVLLLRAADYGNPLTAEDEVA